MYNTYYKQQWNTFKIRICLAWEEEALVILVALFWSNCCRMKAVQTPHLLLIDKDLQQTQCLS